MLKFENILKGIITTLIGTAMLCYSLYAWHLDWISDWQAIVIGCIGFALLFLRVKIEETLGKLLGDLPAMVWDKFFGKKDK